MKKIVLIKYVYLSLVLVISFLMISFKLGEENFRGDEARLVIKAVWILKGLWRILHLSFSRSTFSSFYGLFAHTHPPLEIILPIPFILFQVNEFTFRLPYVLCGMITVVFCFWFIKKEISEKIAYLSLPAFAFSPFLVGWSRNADYPLIHIFLSGMLVYLLCLFIKYKTKKYYYYLIICLITAFFTQMDFLVVMPMIIYYSYKPFIKMTPKIRNKGLYIFLLTVGLFYLTWILISFFYLSGYLGLRYIFYYKLKTGGDLYSYFQYLITNFIFDFNIFPWLIFLPSALVFLKKNKLVQVLVAFCVSYFIAFFLLGQKLPYFFNIYLPLIFLCLMGMKKINNCLVIIFFIIVGVGNFLLSVSYLKGKPYPTSLVWSFNKKNSLKEIGFIIRQCLTLEEKYLSDDDGYATDLYFNRKYPRVVDQQGLDYAIQHLDTQEIKAIVLTDTYLKNNPNLSFYLNNISFVHKKFNDKRNLFLLKNCSFAADFNSSIYNDKYGNFFRIIDFKR